MAKDTVVIWYLIRKQRFLVCPPSGNIARKSCFLVCPPSKNMARKQCFLICPPSGNITKKQCFLVCPCTFGNNQVDNSVFGRMFPSLFHSQVIIIAAYHKYTRTRTTIPAVPDICTHWLVTRYTYRTQDHVLVVNDFENMIVLLARRTGGGVQNC